VTANRTPTLAVRHPLLALLLCTATVSALPVAAQSGDRIGAPNNAITAQSDTPATTPAPRPYTPYVNRNLIFLDPAHGGTDDGAHIGEHTLEKDITLALASRIRTVLLSENITVLTTRETDATSTPVDPLTPAQSNDSRAGIANHAHPSACVLLHATGSGIGVHVITSDLDPLDPTDLTPNRPVPWETAQAGSISQSLRLASDMATSLSRAGLPVHLTRSSVRPINSLTCPAVAVEMAPLGSATTPVSDPTYQARVAQAVATALLFWRTQADPNPASPILPVPTKPSISPTPKATGSSTEPAAQSQAAAPRRTPKPVSPSPANGIASPPPRNAPPAPIIRRSPTPRSENPPVPSNSGAPEGAPE
jgi:N-acetylmuramoyl-L-alanine amidase